MGTETPTGNGQPVRYPQLLRDFGTKCESEWGQAAQGEITRVKDTLTEPRHFGEIPAAQQFASVYRAAQHVYTATLEGLKTDLEAAGAALRAAADSMNQTDEASADAFRQLQTQWGAGAGMGSSTSHDDAENDAPAQEGSQAQQNLQGDPNPSAPDPEPEGTPGAAAPSGSTTTGGSTTPTSSTTPVDPGMTTGD